MYMYIFIYSYLPMMNDNNLKLLFVSCWLKDNQSSKNHIGVIYKKVLPAKLYLRPLKNLEILLVSNPSSVE